MIMIIGGRTQGKKEYAISHYKDAKKHMIMLNDMAKENFSKSYVNGNSKLFDELPKAVIEAINNDPNCIIITDEVGCGLIPNDSYERGLRDYIGRIQIKLAKEADEVIKVTCSLGMKIK